MDILITIAFLALYYILGLGTVIALKTGIEEDVELEHEDYLAAACFPVIQQIKHCLFRHIKTGLL